ncbi:phosphate acyltransferase, partial [Salmonella enterica subsp. enterica serovar Kentucky]|nr:phosphate acyltransferase [Salmonella enterica subsp. enterica serovar Kentucky]
DPRFKEYWSEYYQIMKRRGVTQEQAQRAMIGNHTAIGAIMVQSVTVILNGKSSTLTQGAGNKWLFTPDTPLVDGTYKIEIVA